MILAVIAVLSMKGFTTYNDNFLNSSTVCKEGI